MKQFFKMFFASMFGFILGMFLLIIIVAAIFGSLANSGTKSKTASVEKNSILELDLNYAIPERTNNNNFNGVDWTSFGSKVYGLNDIIANIKKAQKDENIVGIKINCGLNPNSYALLEDIRKALVEFKSSGKFILAYGEVIDEHSYYVASVSDSIFIHPAGNILLNGFSSQVVYLKNMFDKIGVEPQLIRHGKFKSAGEPLIANKMSDENRAQISSYMGNVYSYFTTVVAKARGIDEAILKNIIENLEVKSPSDAVAKKVADAVWYADEVEQYLKKRTAVEDDKKLNLVQLKKYQQVSDPDISISDNKVAVVYCDGDIVDGKGDEESVGSTKIAEIIHKIRNDKNYKALVLRINSPGGSALASDVIWREVTLAKKKMPVVVSMGSVAASGGYYIAAPATKIFAQPNTITGSIGVFGLLLNAKELLNNKLGVNIETVNFGKYADMGIPDRPLTNDERAIIQGEIDRVYDNFISKVAEGRKLKVEQVDALAQGRVYSGIEAKALGLVDEFGDLNKAIIEAAKLAKADEYRTVNFPEISNPFDEIFSMLTENTSTYLIKHKIGEENYRWYNEFKKLENLQGVQVRMPLDIRVY